jgi:hypothetical protein
MKASLKVVTPSKRKKRDTRVGLLNPEFVYTRAAETDIRKRFARILAEQAKGKKT